MKLPQGEVKACLFHSERKQKSEEDRVGQSWVVVEDRPGWPSPAKGPPSTLPLAEGSHN